MTNISDPAISMGWLNNLAPGAKYNEITMRRYSENGMPMLPDDTTTIMKTPRRHDVFVVL